MLQKYFNSFFGYMREEKKRKQKKKTKTKTKS